MKLETIAITKLTPDPENARQHDETNLKSIEGSLREFGQRKPIVISQTNVIVAGNGTVEAAKRLGWTDIQAVRVPADWDANRIKAFALADNRTAELADWSPQVLAEQLLEIEEAGFDIKAFGFERVESQKDVKDIIEDEIPLSVISRVAFGDVWQLGQHRIMCGDATSSSQLDRLLDGSSNIVCFTSPPYNAGKSAKLSGNSSNKIRENLYENYDDDQSSESWSELCSKSLENALTKSDLVVYNIQMLAGNKKDFFKWIAKWSDNLIDVGIWDKQHGAPQISKNVMSNRFEFLLFFSPNKNPSRAIPTADFQGTLQNVYVAPPQRQNEYAALHGATFPTHLPSYIINNFAKNHSVLDVFAGTGTTLIAAEQLNKPSFAMELDPKYCDVIIQRWENLTGKKAELING